MNRVSYDDMDFIEFQSGTFLMGKLENDEHASDLETNRAINITNPFYIQTTPVTVNQYAHFLNDTGSEKDYLIEIWNGNNWVESLPFKKIMERGNDYPVVGVSYLDAQKFIAWLSKKYKKQFRLPTEAEFEYAAKSNCSCKSECYYAQEVKKKELTRKDGCAPVDGARKVKTGVKTLQGLYDMHGLVWQWCNDWFYFYDNNDINDPKGPKDQPEYSPWKGEKWFPGKVIRGGSFSYPYYYSKCSNRHYSKITDRNYNLGFRVCFSDNHEN